jgi:hypothetical protein
MLALFKANPRSTGRFEPKTGQMFTEPKAVTAENFVLHLQGKQGVGLVPVLDDDTCWWAAIDIDNHGEDDDIPIAPLDRIVIDLQLPLMLCRSKSGGVHAYLFLSEPQKAGRIMAVMAKWAAALGHAGSEVFPKQAHLVQGKDGKRQTGNWINLPYHNADDTVRYAFRGKVKLSLDQFLDVAEKLRVTPDALNAKLMLEHAQAPPCVQRMMREGVPVGHRNEGMYNVVVYLRKAFPDDTEARALDLNKEMFSKPLVKQEAMRTIASAMKPDYGYRCNEEPVRSLCDRPTCLKRKFGITSVEVEKMEAISALPIFSDVVQYMSEPVRWEIRVDGHKVTNIGTDVLLEWKAIRQIVAEQTTKLVPMIKNQEWERILQPLMATARKIEAPDDASIAGVVRQRLKDFAAKTDLLNKGQDPEDRKALMRGMPVVQLMDGERCVVFRQHDFVSYLKRTKSEELKGVSLWFAIRGLGVQHVKMRVGQASINVWYLPVHVVMEREGVKIPDFRTEL